MNRRGFLTGLISFTASAPAIVRAVSLMPVRSIVWDGSADPVAEYMTAYYLDHPLATADWHDAMNLRFNALMGYRVTWHEQWRRVSAQVLPPAYLPDIITPFESHGADDGHEERREVRYSA